ncbi:hypothetical protein MtrunA17_Chr7g0272901 [Medicago truncatula]|uniref:Transmembrane protein, putative n=1 Tax=Medicago truncatula TaxID=3880 RepID=G7KYP3_MEDTR|nr:uncharacterized protein LOC11431311 [Medicago truncatula]AES82511.2 transmembrane protein, putative [Medicago truncatula]RHN49288.1 hypothetical protein MtrunA17_Chr7g0272901 [Medicago truncatula]
MDPSTVQQQQQMTVNQPPRPPITSSRPPVVPYDLMFPFLIPHLHLAAELQFLFAKYKMCVCVSNSNAFPILLTKLFVLSIFMSFVLEMKYPGILCYEVCYTLWGVNCLSQQQQKWQNRKEPTKVLLLAHLSEIMNDAMDHSHITSSALQVKSEPTYSIMDISLNS